MIITESFDRKTLVAMEMALDRACESLGAAKEQHEARRHIASTILQCALRGNRTLGALTEAGRAAAMQAEAMDSSAIADADSSSLGRSSVGRSSVGNPSLGRPTLGSSSLGSSSPPLES